MRASTVFRTLLPIALVFAVVWLIVIIYWRETYRFPNTADVALYLLGIPSALILGFIIFKKSIDLLRRKVAAPASAGAAGVASDNVRADPELAYTLDVLGGALRLPLGGNADEVLAALADGQRPKLHAKLKDAQGLPIFAAPVADLDVSETRRSLDALPIDDENRIAWSEEQLRALTLAADVLDELIEMALPLLPMPAPPDSHGPTPTAIPASSILNLYVLLPETWKALAREHATAWLDRRAQQTGWPLTQLRVHAAAISDSAQALALLDQINIALHRTSSESLCLMLACDSLIGERTTAEWDSARRLLSAKRPEGQVPGEGAAGLLLRRPARDGASTPASTPRLHRVVAASHEKPVTAGRAPVAVTTALLTRAMAIGGCDPGKISGVLSDLDQRPSRAGELAHALTQTLSEIDLATQSLGIGIGCGDCGSVAGLAAIVLAVAKAGQEQQSMLVASVADPQARAALVVTAPASEPAMAEVVAA